MTNNESINNMSDQTNNRNDQLAKVISEDKLNYLNHLNGTLLDREFVIDTTNEADDEEDDYGYDRSRSYSEEPPYEIW